MTEQKRTKIKTLTAAILVIYVAGSLIGLVQLLTGHAPIPEPVSQETFVENAQVQAKTEVIGSNIRLLQAIYGVDDEITYRYSVETDCPSWDYEDRYTTTKPLTWVSDTSAVETFATNIAVWYDGTMYASDQHYEVPLFFIGNGVRHGLYGLPDLCVGCDGAPAHFLGRNPDRSDGHGLWLYRPLVPA